MARVLFKNDGKIYAKELNDRPAEDTINNILNLNSPNIVEDRLEVMTFFDEEISQKTDAEVSQFIQEYLDRDRDGKYQHHWTMIKDIYSDFII